jgi:hypothetical protein
VTSRNAAIEVLRLIDATIPALRCAPDDLGRSFGAAGLMRSCALLKGILTLDDARLGALTGILARQHWETWLVSLYVVLGGDEGIRAVMSDNIYWRRKLDESLKLGGKHQPKWPGSVVKLNYRALSKRVLELLQSRGEPNPGPIAGYEITYSFQSTFSLHANLSTITPHIEYGSDAWTVNADAPGPLADQLLTPVLHTVHLAQYVFKDFGLDSTGLEAQADALLRSQSRGGSGV